ncbi:hypothetical protein [Vibrio nomapromontoriensis]|uniref:hypothetical protein n=1 Tax=Vibrio nomapromontoriensis TaxID=2910246 RepID=UPI003D09A311
MFRFFTRINWLCLLAIELIFVLGLAGAFTFKEELTLHITPPCSNSETDIFGNIKFNRLGFESYINGTDGSLVPFNGGYLRYFDAFLLVGKSDSEGSCLPFIITKIEKYESKEQHDKSMNNHEGCIFLTP